MQNPVYPAYFADPFVLRHNGEYYAYGTAGGEGEGVQVLYSPDMVHWHPQPACLMDSQHIWAPEVTYRDGVFYMYYSAGGAEGEGHQLRVATSPTPLGPFVPRPNILTPDEPFSIDASPFQDDDGTWYLFYCKDFLEGERVGTGIVVDRLVQMDQLAGEARVVVRPHADWQIFQKDRFWYDKQWDAWYTVEGPFAVKRNGKVYLFFSGGAWKEQNYGLSWAVADHPLGPYELQTGEAPSLLATVPDKIIGPGHACVATGPDAAKQFIVYHAWDPEHTGRTMRIDPLTWTPAGPACAGATLGSQPEPAQAAPLSWKADSGSWAFSPGRAVQTADSPQAAAHATLPAADFQGELWFRALHGRGQAGLVLGDHVLLYPAEYHLRHLRFQCVGGKLGIWLDGVRQPEVDTGALHRLGLVTMDAPVQFSGIALAQG
jgi:GH43 family beta-xylosidase